MKGEEWELYTVRHQVISCGSVYVISSDNPAAIFSLPFCTAAVASAHKPAELPRKNA